MGKLRDPDISIRPTSTRTGAFNHRQELTLSKMCDQPSVTIMREATPCESEYDSNTQRSRSTSTYSGQALPQTADMYALLHNMAALSESFEDANKTFQLMSDLTAALEQANASMDALFNVNTRRL